MITVLLMSRTVSPSAKVLWPLLSQISVRWENFCKPCKWKTYIATDLLACLLAACCIFLPGINQLCTESLQRQCHPAQVALRQAEVSRLLTLRGDDLRHGHCQSVPQAAGLHGPVWPSDGRKSSTVAPVPRLLAVSMALLGRLVY